MSEESDRGLETGGGGAPAAGILLSPDEVAAIFHVEGWPRHRVRALLGRLGIPLVEASSKRWWVRRDTLVASLAEAGKRAS